MALENPLKLNFTKTSHQLDTLKRTVHGDGRKINLNQELESVRIELTEKDALIKELQTKNKRLHAENLKIQQRQELLVEELKKAEHQFLQLKDLVFKQIISKESS